MFKVYNLKLPKGQEDFKFFCISDIYINSDEKYKVQIKKLKKDIEFIKNMDDAVVVLNGNLFWFDEKMFKFDAIPFLKAVKLYVKNIDRVKEDFDVFLDVFKDLEAGENKVKHFEKMSDDARLYSLKRLIKEDEDFEKNPVNKKLVEMVYPILARKLYDDYVDMYAKLFEPIKDKIAVLNPGNEEEKVINNQQYDPMYLLADKLGIPKKYNGKLAELEIPETERFWELRVKFNSRLTDNRPQEMTMLGSYGILQAKKHKTIQTKMNAIFEDFRGYDYYITSGYEKSFYNPRTVLYPDQQDNVIKKTENYIAFAGYRKVAQPNKVRMASYRAENELNNNYLSISMVRNPAYISEDNLILKDELETLIQESGKDTNSTSQDYEKQSIHLQPYVPYFDFMEFGLESQILNTSENNAKMSKVESNILLNKIKEKLESVKDKISDKFMDKIITARENNLNSTTKSAKKKVDKSKTPAVLTDENIDESALEPNKD